ncbi:MAG TPA: peptide chain release factor N(5)-glutamine methyltransferase [Thermoanaerobaculia bacterium]|nr:peptide chain release factor N(5)-glutamine methyltransferase [Thermoanaerobaculia bacterium]
MSRESLGDVRSRFRDEALQRGISPRDVDLLLADLLDKPAAWILAHGDAPFDAAPLEALMARRFSGEPLQYIRGRTEFFSREFFVDDRVLIPRPETEILVETILARAPRGARIVDIGTGSGCIAISLERTRPDMRVTGVDVSFGALAVADRNRRRLSSRIGLCTSNLLGSVGAGLDLVVSNPPYIAEGEIAALAPEVRLYEPRMALTPGPSGLETIERILAESHALLAPGGLVILEIGYGQQQQVREMAAAARFTVEEMVPDLAGIDRVVVSSKRGSD